MSMRLSRTSTIRPLGTFAGALPIVSTRRWNPIERLVDDSGTGGFISIVNEYECGVRTRFELESTGDAPSSVPRDLVIRFLCHAIVERLPTEALVDVWESLHDAWEWSSRPTLPTPKPESPPITVHRVLDPVEEAPFRFREE